MKIHCDVNCPEHKNFTYRSALVREDVTCKVCKRSDAYKKLPSRKQVKIYNPKRGR